MYKGNLIFFCGAGGTGKTLLASAIQEKSHYNKFASPTREFYALKGVESESKLFEKDIAYKKQFQKDLYDFYLGKINDYAEAAATDTVFERSPFCNLGYLLFHNPDFTLQEVNHAFNKAVNAMVHASELGWVPLVVLFPYPTSWILQGKNDDKFRHISGGKDTIVHAIMEHFTWKAFKQCGVGVIELSEAPIEDWVEEVMTSLHKKIS